MPRFPKAIPCLLNVLLVAAVAALSACSTSRPAFQEDQLLSSAPNEFSRSFSYGHADACEASRRALLSQGYMTTTAQKDGVDATKNFQPTHDSHIVVEVHVVCTPGDATNTSIVYVNAIQNGYALKKSDTSASVGLSILGSVSVPIRSNSDAMVKISSETIQSSAFYKRFFELVTHYLNESSRSEAIPDTMGAITITPLPPVVAAAAPAVMTAAPVPVLAGTAMPKPVVVPTEVTATPLATAAPAAAATPVAASSATAAGPAVDPILAAAQAGSSATPSSAPAIATAPAAPTAPAAAIAPKAAAPATPVVAQAPATGSSPAGAKAIDAVSTTTNAASPATTLTTP